jgi:hypothetical protein
VWTTLLLLVEVVVVPVLAAAEVLADLGQAQVLLFLLEPLMQLPLVLVGQVQLQILPLVLMAAIQHLAPLHQMVAVVEVQDQAQTHKVDCLVVVVEVMVLLVH